MSFRAMKSWVAILSACLILPIKVSAADLGNKPAQTREGIRVLLVTGVDYPGHHWQQTAPALKDLLERDPRLKVQIVENPDALGSPRLADWDVILLHFMNWETTSPGNSARRNLQEFVRGGKGLVLLHFACGAWQDWPEFKSLVGRVWNPKARPHDPYGEFRVQIADTAHPITQGLSSFSTTDELYTCLMGDAPIQLLATARSSVDGQNYPMAFVLNYGKGRVFHTVLGHDIRAITNSALPLLLQRACSWTAGIPIGERSPSPVTSTVKNASER